MQIKSTINGSVSNVRGDIARELVRMGVAEVVGEGPEEIASRLPRFGDAPKLEPIWEVNTFDIGIEGAKVLGIKMRIGQHTAFYIGKPEHLNWKKDHVGNFFTPAFGRAVPDEIVNEFKARYLKASTWEKLVARGGELPSVVARDITAGTYHAGE